MVVVDDVVGFMFRLRSEKSKFSLLLHFLHFLGVQTHPHRHSVCHDSICMNQATVTELATIRSIPTSALTISSKTERWSDVLSPPAVFLRQNLASFVSNALVQAQNYFSDAYKKRIIVMWIIHSLETVFSSNKASTRRMKTELKDLRKKLKTTLRDEIHRDHLELWALFGRLDWILGDYEEAYHVFETTLNVQGLKTENRERIWKFAKTYVDLLLGNDPYVSRFDRSGCKVDRKRILWVLAYLGSREQHVVFKGQEVSSVLQLKARKGYETVLSEQMECALTTDSHQEFLTDCVACFAEFLYITQNIDAAKNVYEHVYEMFKSHKKETSLTSEVILTSYLQLLSFHIVHHGASLSTIRPTLERALSLFPSNPQFLELLLDLEGGAYVAGRLRRFVGRVVNLFPRLIPIFWYYVVCGELKRLKMLQEFITEDGSNVNCEIGTTWKVRSLFETALKSSQHCPLFWRLYMKFENEYGDPNRVKSIFYRSLRNCPWTKAMYMDALCYCPNDLQEVMDLMGEKELRIRTPLEEIELLMQHEPQPEDGVSDQSLEAESPCDTVTN